MRILATLLLLSVALPAAAQNHPRIAVMPLKAKRIEKDVVFIMDALLVSQLSRLGQFEVISATDIQAMLEAEGMKDALGCDEVTCAAEIGGALNARSTLTGTVGKLGRTIVINLTLFDNEKMVALNRSTVEVEDDENLFAQAVRQVLGSLFDVAVPPASRVSRRPQPQGTPSSLPANNLEVTTDPPGAYVIIDGKLAGQTPIARRLDFGEYTMHIEREGYVPSRSTVQAEGRRAIQRSPRPGGRRGQGARLGVVDRRRAPRRGGGSVCGIGGVAVEFRVGGHCGTVGIATVRTNSTRVLRHSLHGSVATTVPRQDRPTRAPQRRRRPPSRARSILGFSILTDAMSRCVGGRRLPITRLATTQQRDPGAMDRSAAPRPAAPTGRRQR